MRLRTVITALALSAPGLASMGGGAAATTPQTMEGLVKKLTPDHQPLAAEFEEGQGHPRLIVILSPT